MVSGARSFAYTMTPVERGEWDLCASPTETGIEIWIRILSAILSGGVAVPIGGTACVPSVPPTVPTFDVDPVGGTIDFRGDISDAETGSQIVLRMSRPLKPGVMPRLEDTRMLGSVDPNTDVDVASLFSSRFGSLPVAGSKALMLSRAVHPQSRRMSVLTFSVADVGGSSDTCSVSSVDPSTVPFGSIDLDTFASFGGFPLNESLSFAVLTAGWAVVTGSTQSNEVPGLAEVEDLTGIDRVQTVEFKWYPVSTGVPICSGFVDLTVASMGPPP